MNTLVDKVTKKSRATVDSATVLSTLKARQARNYDALTSQEVWARRELAIHEAASNIQDFVYKIGEWMVRSLGNGIFICSLGVYKVTLTVAKAAVWGLAAIRTGAEILWETIRDTFRAVLLTTSNAYDASYAFLREAGGRLRATVTDRKTGKAPTVSSKAITVMA